MNKEFKIGNVTISPTHEPFVIAEMSGNHNQSLDKALAIVDAAKATVVHALKIQTYTADTITIDAQGGLFSIDDAGSLWKGENLYGLYEKAHTPWDWHQAIFDRAREKELIIFSSPFDETAVDFLEGLDAPAYKIASFECTHVPLLRKVAQTGKPIIMSTGMASLEEIEESVKVLKDNGCENLVLLKCTSSYPASPIDSNINTIPELMEKFGCIAGLSDHTLGMGVAVASISLGARVLEKHFILDRSEGGVDSVFSMEPQEMTALVDESKRAFEGLGTVSFGPTKAEENSVRFRRSIYVVEDIEEGEVFTEKNVRIIRPGDGLAPKYIDEILGKTAKQELKRATPFQKEFY